MRFWLVTTIFLFAGTMSFADGVAEEYEAVPELIDVSKVERQMSASFPALNLGNGTPTRDALSTYRKKLERFRQDDLEGLARRIEQICVGVKKYEEWLNQRGRENTITRSRYESGIADVASIREQCSTQNYGSSDYWQLYERMLVRYREEAKSSQRMLDDCFSQNACRQRKV